MKKTMIMFFVFAAYLAFLSGHAFGYEFCVSDETGFQDALNTADGNGQDDIIKLEQGMYTGNFFYRTYSGETNDITILGGYTSGCNDNDRVLDPTNTILDGGESDRVLNLYAIGSGPDFTIEGFTIQNGDCVNSGGGIYAYTTTSSTAGGTITINNNIITDNTGNVGGGVYARTVTATGTTGDIIIIDNIITQNTSNSNSGGVAATAYSSDSGTAGGIILVNNIIADNTALGLVGGGVSADSDSASGTPGTVTITNNTITGNSAIDYGGGVEIDRQGGTINFYNNIVSGNTTYSNYYDIDLSGTGGTANGFNNNYDLDPGGMNGSWDSGETSNIDVDPLFVNASAGNYRLKPRSLCIDAGETLAPQIPNFDIEGNDRIIDGNRDGIAIVDMGAYEYVPRSLISHILLLLSQ